MRASVDGRHVATAIRRHVDGRRRGSGMPQRTSSLAPPHATPAAIASAVGRLLDDDSIAGAARAAAVEVADMPSADGVLGDLLGVTAAV